MIRASDCFADAALLGKHCRVPISPSLPSSRRRAGVHHGCSARWVRFIFEVPHLLDTFFPIAKLRLRSGARFPFTEGQLDQIWNRYERLRGKCILVGLSLIRLTSVRLARNNTPGLGWLIGVVMPLESVGTRMNGDDFEAMMGELRV